MCFCLNIKERSGYGTGRSRADRMQHFIPATIYGPQKPTMHFNIYSPDLIKYLNHNTKLKNQDFCLLRDEQTTIKGTIKCIQFYPVTDKILHLDFIYS